MSRATDALSLAGDIFVTCLILTIGIICGRMSNQMSQASSTVINQNTSAYLESEIASLLASDHTGASTMQYINKYRRKMNIELITKKSASVNDTPMIISATTSLAPLNDKNSNFYIKKTYMFSCEADKDSNGYYRTLRFIQEGVQPSQGHIVISTPSQAQEQLSALVGANTTLDWGDLVSTIKEQTEASNAAKISLIDAVNSHSANSILNDSSSWNSITNETISRLDEYQNSLNCNVNATAHNRVAFSLSGNGEFELDFSPSVIITKNDVSGATNVWASDAGVSWTNGNSDITISNKTVRNNSTTDTYSVVVYY